MVIKMDVYKFWMRAFDMGLAQYQKVNDKKEEFNDDYSCEFSLSLDDFPDVQLMNVVYYL